VANFDAVVVLVLAALGLAATALTILGAGRELRPDRRFRRRIAAQARARLKGAWVIPDQRPLAFCAGLLRANIYISTGLVAQLDEVSLDAVLAREAYHAHRRDPLRVAGGRALARGCSSFPGSPSSSVATRPSPSPALTRCRSTRRPSTARAGAGDARFRGLHCRRGRDCP
jgi:hypothetical protein